MQRDHRHAPGTAAGPAAFDRPSVGKHTLTEALPIFQAKGIAQAQAQASDAAPPPARGAGRAMPAPVQAKMEHAFGADFSAVRVHEDGAAEAMGAHAFARGSDLHFARGQYAPDSPAGQELLGHELAHVVQQSQGRVSTPAQAKGGRNDDPSLEREADDHGARAARGERVGTGGGAASGHAVQAKINYDKTWAKAFGFGAWHAGSQQLWSAVEPAYNTHFLALIGWLDGAGQARCNLLAAWAAGCKATDAATTQLQTDHATIRTFIALDNTNISLVDGQRIQNTLMPLLNFRTRLETWHTTQVRDQQAAANALHTNLRDHTDASIHADLELLDAPAAFQTHRTGRETVLRELQALGRNPDPDDIRLQLAAATRNNKHQTYATWVAELIQEYETAKDTITPRKLARKQAGVAKKESAEREAAKEKAKAVENQKAYDAQIAQLRLWAGNSWLGLCAIYEVNELAQLRESIKFGDVGRMAAISTAVPGGHVTKPKMITLLETHNDDLAGLARLALHGKLGFQMLADGATIAHANEVLDDAQIRRFLALFGDAAVKMAAKNTHGPTYAAFTGIAARIKLPDDWLAPHFAALVSLHKKITNTPGVDHFLITYGQAGLNALINAAGTVRGLVDLSVLREQLQAGKGITYMRYQARAPQTMGAVGDSRRDFADSSAAELAAFDASYERSDKTLTRAEKLRFMGKEEKDTKSFTASDWEKFKSLDTWAHLEPDERETLRDEDRRDQHLRVHATMQLQLRSGEVVARPLEVFVSGGEHGSAYDYDGADGKKDKKTGQLAEGSKASALTYPVTGQSREDYRGVDHNHIGHHDGSREHDAEAKIVSQTIAALEADAETKNLNGATLRIFVDRYTCPSCSDLLYKAKTTNKVFARLAAVEVIYTGART